MKRLLLSLCCAICLTGCGGAVGGSTADPAPKAEAVESNTQTATFGGFVAEVPSSWIPQDDYYCLGDAGYYPVIQTVVFDDYNTIDDLFNYSGSTKDYIDGVCDAFEPGAIHDQDMSRITYGQNTGLNFIAAGIRDGAKVSIVSTLFSNPGGGVVSISLWCEEGDNKDAVASYYKILYGMEPASGLDRPADSLQPTTGDKNALAQAEKYLNSMAFSKKGLMEQLEYEGYTNSESYYAVCNCSADWNEQAVSKARAYLKSGSFSRSALIEQLEYEGFTKKQAEYAASQVYDN